MKSSLGGKTAHSVRIPTTGMNIHVSYLRGANAVEIRLLGILLSLRVIAIRMRTLTATSAVIAIQSGTLTATVEETEETTEETTGILT